MLKDILISVMSVSVCAAVASFLAPSGKNGALSKQVSFACAIALCCVLAAPLKDLSGIDLTDIAFTEPSGGTESDSVSFNYSDVLARQIEFEIKNRFGAEYVSVILSVEKDKENIQIISATLYCDKNSKDAAAYISSLLGGDIPVSVQEVSN